MPQNPSHKIINLFKKLQREYKNLDNELLELLWQSYMIKELPIELKIQFEKDKSTLSKLQLDRNEILTNLISSFKVLET